MDPLPVNSLVETLAYRAATAPAAPAYAYDTAILSYGQLHDDVQRMAGRLSAEGLRPGDRCAVLLPTSLNFVRGFYAVQAARAVPMAINPDLPAAFLVSRLEAVQCRQALVPRSKLNSFPSHPTIRWVAIEDLEEASQSDPVRSPLPCGLPGDDDPALLAATSGTSGEHRTALLLHRNLMASVRSSAARLQIRPDDILVNWAPLYHGLGLMRFLLGGLYFGCPVFLVSPALLQLRRWLETITRVRATVTGAPDFGYRMAADLVKPDGLDLSSLRYAMNSGEPIRISTIERFEQKFGVPDVIRPGYGLSEANGVTNLAPGESRRFDASGNLSCGRPADGLELQIVDEQGRSRPTGSPGEIRLRGAQVFAGYCDDENATREKLKEGWLYTGDIGHVDGDGHLYIHGRKRALIKRGGAMIVPRDVEEPAEKVAGVVAAGAIGVDRAARGIEDLVIIAEVSPDAVQSRDDQSNLIRAIADAISTTRGLLPNEVILVTANTLPRTPNGKLRHEELKRHYTSGTLARLPE
jgi:acyl-CoA synthetase (AMP-forming)/AMP-acid ligase II